MPSDVREHVAGALRAEMARRRLSHRDVAARCGRSHPWITDRLNGKVAITVDDLALLAEVLELEITDFLPTSGRAA